MPLRHLPSLLVDEGGDVGQHLHGVVDGLGTQGELTKLTNGDDPLVGGMEVVTDIHQIDREFMVVVVPRLRQQGAGGRTGDGQVAGMIRFLLGRAGKGVFGVHAPLGRSHGQGKHLVEILILLALEIAKDASQLVVGEQMGMAVPIGSLRIVVGTDHHLPVGDALDEPRRQGRGQHGHVLLGKCRRQMGQDQLHEGIVGEFPSLFKAHTENRTDGCGGLLGEGGGDAVGVEQNEHTEKTGMGNALILDPIMPQAREGDLPIPVAEHESNGSQKGDLTA